MKNVGIKLYIAAAVMLALGFLMYKSGSLDGMIKAVSFVRYGEENATGIDGENMGEHGDVSANKSEAGTDVNGKTDGVKGYGDDGFESENSAKEKENLDGSKTRTGNTKSFEDEESNSDVRYITYEIKKNLKDKQSYYEYKNDKLAWWFKRDAEHGKAGCDDTIDISKYGGYYLDNSKYEVLDGNDDNKNDDNKNEDNENGYNENEDNELDNKTQAEKVLYLTFDCGYENGYTERILDVLKKQNVPACFFVTQTFVRDNVDLVRRMKSEGHQVGNHTITHPSMPTKSFEEIVKEVEGSADFMKEATGYQMDPYLRPPMGEYSERTLSITQDLGYKTIFWSMAYLDYDVNKQPGANYVIEHFNKYHHNGAIILMHNVSSSNAAALETVITNMKNQGYRFASLNELGT